MPEKFEKITVKRFTDKLLARRFSNLKQVNDGSHSLALVKTIRGVDYVNDSRATNIESVYHSIRNLHRPVIWIANAADPQMDFSLLEPLLAQKVKAVICMGRYRSRLMDQLLENMHLYVVANTLTDAVKLSEIYSTRGDIVLFSPGCPAQPEYKDFQTRGDHFQYVVNEISPQS